MGAIFPTAFAHFESLCHILVILSIFQTFSSPLCLLWLSVISDITIAKAQMIAFFSKVIKVCTFFKKTMLSYT